MWFLFAFSFALITSVNLMIAKKLMQDMNEYLLLWLSGILTLPFLFFIVVFFYQIPKLDMTFWANILVIIILNSFAAVFAYKAIKISDVSLVSPISAFNPVFTAIISYIFLQELLSSKGVIGITLVCVGAYILQLSKKSKGLLEPLRALLRHKGVQLSMAAYFIWAITPVFQKTAIFHTTPSVPPFASMMGLVGTTLIFTSPAIKFSENWLPLARRHIKLLILLGLLGGVGQTVAFIAFSLTNLGFATAVFKLSIIFSVLFGWIFLKEQNIKERILGSMVMLLGVILLVI